MKHPPAVIFSALVIAVLSGLRPGIAAASRHVFVGTQRQGVAGVTGISGAQDVTVRPDGAHVYVSGTGFAIFARQITSGALAFVGTVTVAAPRTISITADGAHAYLASSSPGSIVVYSRDSGTGLLTLVEEQHSGDIAGLGGAVSVALSPDNAHVYVTGAGADSVVVFSRNVTTGELTHVETHTDGLGGVDGLNRAYGAVVSPDGDHVYASGSDDDAIAIFSRNVSTGELTYIGIVQDGVGGVDGLDFAQGISMTADGNHLYAAAEGGIAALARDAGTGALSFVEHEAPGSLSNPSRVTVSSDGQHVYGVSGIGADALVVFTRDSGTGALTVEEEFFDGAGGVDGLGGASGISVSPDNNHVYVAALENAVATFRKVGVSCSSVAMGSCFQPAEANKAKLVLSDDSLDDGRDKLVWKWLRGAALTVGDFGDPATTLNDYALCVYSNAGSTLEAELLAPAGGGCLKPSDGGSLPCWKALAGLGFKYKRPDRHPDGVVSMKMLAGAATESKILAKAKGESVPMPALPLTLPVTVQLQNANGACWEAEYSTAIVNDGVTLKALAD